MSLLLETGPGNSQRSWQVHPGDPPLYILYSSLGQYCMTGSFAQLPACDLVAKSVSKIRAQQGSQTHSQHTAKEAQAHRAGS